jgi:hypothetical protein
MVLKQPILPYLKIITSGLLLILFVSYCKSQNNSELYKIYGTITDSAGTTLLASATVIDKKTNVVANSNADGVYQISLSYGEHELQYSFIGYKNVTLSLNVSSDQLINVKLTPESIRIKEVIIDARSSTIQNVGTGTIELNKKEVGTLPLFLGESDFYKALQLMPGVQLSGEGNAAIYVRGGGYDQNLILLDGATVYNPTHLLGFFSVFNTDIINNVTMTKSGIPAEYGNRISSVLDFNTKSSIPEQLTINGNLGIISSGLNIDLPVFKHRGAFFLAGRKTYLNTLLDGCRDLGFIKHNSILYKTRYDFYDLNGSFVLKLSSRDRIMLSSYQGNDLFVLNSGVVDLHTDMSWGNQIASLSWNHSFTDRLYMENQLVKSDYSLKMQLDQNQFQFHLRSNINDVGFKNRITYVFKNHKIRMGIALIRHNIVPNTSNAKTDSLDYSFGTPNNYHSYEMSVFVSDEIKLTSKLSVIAGFRFNSFYHVGPFGDYTSTDTTYYGKGQIIKNYHGPDYRFSARYLVSGDASVKLSFNSNNQYVNLVNASSVTFPTDFWIPASTLVQPQKGNQWAAGYYKNIKRFNIEASVEIYYKTFANQIEFNKGILNSVDNTPLDQNLIFGRGRAYGCELLIRKPSGKLNGWIGYTISRTEKSFLEIENGRWFPAKYDRPHDVSVVTNFQFSQKWTFSAVFVYATGSAYTPVVGRYFVGNNLLNQYGNYNSARMPDYHRLDIAATHVLKKTDKIYSCLIFSVYNVYNRHNPFFEYPEATGNLDRYTLKVEPKEVSIFPILPSISWQFKF